MASAVINTGNIIAQDGTIHMAVGDSVTFHLSDHSSVKVTINDEINSIVDQLNAAIINDGNLQAHVVELRAKLSKSLLKQSVSNSGIVQATAMSDVGGRIVIHDDGGVVSNSGILYAGATEESSVAGAITIRGQGVANTGAVVANGGVGEVGGTVHLLGDTIINENALIDVSGDIGGGKVLVGGDFQGKGDVYTARLNLTDPNTVVLADAYSEGDGGRVIFWSDEDTYFNGFVSARGGELSGNGGFTEISGKEFLDMNGDVDLTAANGE